MKGHYSYIPESEKKQCCVCSSRRQRNILLATDNKYYCVRCFNREPLGEGGTPWRYAKRKSEPTLFEKIKNLF